MLSKDDPCDPSTPWNSNTPETAKFANSLAELLFFPIESKLSREAAGARRSIMGRILSDTKGNVYNTHNFYTNFFLSRGFYKDQPSTATGSVAFDFEFDDRGFYPITVGSAIRDEIIKEGDFEDESYSLNYTNHIEEEFKSECSFSDSFYTITATEDSGSVVKESIPMSRKSFSDYLSERAPAGTTISLDANVPKKIIKNFFKLLTRMSVCNSNVNPYSDELEASPDEAINNIYGEDFQLDSYEGLISQISEGFLVL